MVGMADITSWTPSRIKRRCSGSIQVARKHTDHTGWPPHGQVSKVMRDMRCVVLLPRHIEVMFNYVVVIASMLFVTKMSKSGLVHVGA